MKQLKIVCLYLLTMSPFRDQSFVSDRSLDSLLEEYQDTFGQESTTTFVKSGVKFKRNVIMIR